MKKYPENSRVLDYGCGDGALTIYLGKFFNQVIGVDSSLEQVESAIRNGANAKHLSNDDFSEWVDLNCEKFDIIFLFDVLEHVRVDYQIIFMKKLVNLLKKGGVIFIKVPNANSLLSNRWRYNDWTHFNSFTESSLDFVCLNCGLDQPEYFPDESSINPKFWWIPRYSILRFYLKSLFRGLWWLYIRSELGQQAKNIPLGINLFVRAVKK